MNASFEDSFEYTIKYEMSILLVELCREWIQLLCSFNWYKPIKNIEKRAELWVLFNYSCENTRFQKVLYAIIKRRTSKFGVFHVVSKGSFFVSNRLK